MQIYTQKITIIKKGFLMLEGNCWSIFVISITDENECIVYARKVQNLIRENKSLLEKKNQGTKIQKYHLLSIC